MNRGVPIVLLIEHEPIQSVTLARVLKDGGYSVIPVTRANDALEIFVTHHRDIALVVADTQAATFAGPPLLGALHDIAPHVPVVALSPAKAMVAAGASMAVGAASTSVAMAPAAATGRYADLYPNVVATLTKPVAAADLLIHVQHALQSPHLIGTTAFSWPPTEEELDDIEVIDTQPIPTADAPVRDVHPPQPDPPVSFAAHTPPPIEPPPRLHSAADAATPSTQPAAAMELVVRGRDSRRRVHRFPRVDRWGVVAATALCGVSLTTLLEFSGAPIKRAAVGDYAPATVAAPVLAARGYRIGTIELVTTRHVRSRGVAVRMPTAVDSHTPPAQALQPDHRSRSASSSGDTLRPPGPTRTPAVATALARPLAPIAPVASAPASTAAPAQTAVMGASLSSAPRDTIAVRKPAVRDATASASVDARLLARTREDERGIHEVLQQYERAYERLDVNAARAVWPSLNTRALARAFGGLKEQALEFSDCRVAMEPPEATAICGGRATYVPRVGHQTARTESREWTFRLRKVDQDWRIAKAEVR